MKIWFFMCLLFSMIFSHCIGLVTLSRKKFLCFQAIYLKMLVNSRETHQIILYETKNQQSSMFLASPGIHSTKISRRSVFAVKYIYNRTFHIWHHSSHSRHTQHSRLSVDASHTRSGKIFGQNLARLCHLKATIFVLLDRT